MNKKITSVLFSILAVMAHGSPAEPDSTRFEVLMSKKLLNDMRLDAEFIQSIDVTSNRLILLSTKDQFYALGWGGIVALGKKQPNRIGCYAVTPDNQLLVISSNAICSLDPQGNLSRLYKLPNEGMGISAGKKVMYVFDRNKGLQKYALYLLAKGGKYAKLFDLPTPINSVVEMEDSILFASENGLFSYNLLSKKIKPLAALARNREIKSVAVDTSGKGICFSTESMVYAIKDSGLGIIVDKFGGLIRFFDRGLIVFNPEDKVLIRITGVEDELAAKKILKPAKTDNKSNDTLTNATIVNMVKAEVSDDRIINLINRSRVDFNLSVDSMVELAGQNVSSAVIMAMKQAMKKQSAKAL